MSHRTDKLDRLKIGYRCETAWDAMEGSGTSRHCHECRRQVFDFAQMTPRQIETLLQAHAGGSVCGRLSWRGGTLVVAREAPPPEDRFRQPHAMPAIAAATLFTAFLGAGASSAAPPAPAATAVANTAATAATAATTATSSTAGGVPAASCATSATSATSSLNATSAAAATAADRLPSGAPSASLYGRVTLAGEPCGGVTMVARNLFDGHETPATTAADGSFSFARLAPGLYSLAGQKPGYLVVPTTHVMAAGEAAPVELVAASAEEVEQTLTGVITVAARQLRQSFESSHLVITATAGTSRVVRRNHDGTLEIVTELKIDRLIRGKAPAPVVLYRHTEPAPGGAHDGSSGRPELTAGTKILDMLRCTEYDGGTCANPRSIFEENAGDYMRLDDASLASYADHLETLERLDRQAQRTGVADAAALVEWMVHGVETPATRADTSPDLEAALWSLEDVAGSDTTETAAALRRALAQFQAGGGRLSQPPPDALLGALLTDRQRARLTAALQSTETLQHTVGLFTLVRRWDPTAARTWLRHRLEGPPAAADSTGSVDDQLIWVLGFVYDTDDDVLRPLAKTAYDRLLEIQAQARALPAADQPAADQAEVAELLATLRRDLARALAPPTP